MVSPYNIGFQLNNGIKSYNMVGVENNNRSVLLDISAGYRRELFKEVIAGVFRPVIILQAGGAVDMFPLSWEESIEDWVMIYTTGAGIQFYNARILNEIIFKIYRYSSQPWSIALQLAIYWK